ncbi:MAG TPA: hypothetical protein VM658_14700 [bacterium]|nr:hypothetical protein [bacterium]
MKNRRAPLCPLIARCLAALLLSCSLLFPTARPAWADPPGQGPAKPDPGRPAPDQSSSDEEEELIFGEEEKGPEYPSRSLRAQAAARKWEGRVNIGGYFENEAAFDTVQENSREDMIDFRSKIFAYGTYTFSERASLRLSILTLYWILEGGNDKQQSESELYEGYLAFKYPRADLYLGQMLVRWGVCNLFSPTNAVNPVNYRSFIDPDAEDLRIPLPMIKTNFFGEGFTLEALYIPVFRSSVFQLTGSDLALVQTQGARSRVPEGLDPFLTRTLQNYPAQSIDFREQKFLMGEAAVKLSIARGSSQTELVYFATREDFPIVIYAAPDTTNNPDATGDLSLEFNRYELYGITYKTHLKGVDLFTEYAYSPRRFITAALYSTVPPERVMEKTKRIKRPWQAASIELDYLDPEGDFFLKFGAERSTYLNAPEHLFLSSADSLYFLALLRLFLLNNSVMPEWRVINIQAGSNQWFISPRVKYHFLDRCDLTAGLNIFAGAAGGQSNNAQESTPIVILSDNNQFFVSFRWSF